MQWGGYDHTVEGTVHVALDVAPVREQPAGVGVYVTQLTRSLAEAQPAHLSLIGVRPEARALDGVPAGVPRSGFEVNLPGRGRSTSYHAWLQLRAADAAQRSGAALVHYTNASAPLRTRMPFVLTVHDLSVLRMPQLHPLPRLATLPVALVALARAAAVIVPSNAMRTELTRGLRVNPRRVVAIGHAASDVADDDPATAAPVLAELGLAPGAYLLALGTLEPRKNLVRLIGAFERLAPELPELKLALVGDSGWRRGAIDRRIATSAFRDRIVLGGYLPGAAVTALTRRAAAFCYVSVYEGYGLPVIEALAAGAAVVTSRSTGMVEAAGGAAVLVDPYDEADIARGIDAAMRRRDELIVAGRVRAAQRAWADVAAEHARVYRWAAAWRRAR